MKFQAFALMAVVAIGCTSTPPKTAENWRDLNKNGQKDPYEDASQPVAARVEDLLKQMNIEEKAGQMFMNGTGINDDGTIDKKPGQAGPAAMMPSAAENIQQRHMTHFNFWNVPTTRGLATGINAIQKVAEAERLGIPVTFASDPRNHFQDDKGYSLPPGDFAPWCEPLGFGAIGDSALVRQFADCSRREYLAVGIRAALHPQIDLTTEPRWPRQSGTFGEDAAMSGRLGAAWILGFQGKNLTNGVACMTKHFTGGGPQKEGLDPHFEFQKGQVYPGKNFNYHLLPFDAAFAAGTASIMPYYGVPTDQTPENVGFSYNKAIITGLLREKYHFDGVVCTDWGLVSDVPMGPMVVWPARAWGVEKLSRSERVQKIIEAGCDQFGGENCPELIVELVKNGKLTEARIDQSIRRLLRQKFELGLFDNPFVDVEKAVATVGNADFKALAEASQRRAMTLLKNENGTLPLAVGSKKIFLEGIDSTVAAKFGTVVRRLEEADFAILRLGTPWIPVKTDNPFARMFHHGDLDFKEPERSRILAICQKVPTIIDIYLDRPVVFPEINAAARAVVGNFGASNGAVLEVIFGKAKPEGKLPFELPSSMESVRRQKEDLPHDSEKPLYAFGFGLRF